MLSKEEVQKLEEKYDSHNPSVLASCNDIEDLIRTIYEQYKEIHELQTFKHHAEFILIEEMYQQIEEESEAHLEQENAFR